MNSSLGGISMATESSGKRHYCTSCQNLTEQKLVYEETKTDSTPFGKMRTCVCVKCKLKELGYNPRGEQVPGKDSDSFEEWMLWNMVGGKDKRGIFSNEKRYVVLARKLKVDLIGGTVFDNEETEDMQLQQKVSTIKNRIKGAINQEQLEG